MCGGTTSQFHVRMAAAVLLRKRNALSLQAEDEDEESLLDNITAKLPPKEIWESEMLLAILVLGKNVMETSSFKQQSYLAFIKHEQCVS
jgi:hypothetical protein